jgi:hypothetical protein
MTELMPLGLSSRSAVAKAFRRLVAALTYSPGLPSGVAGVDGGVIRPTDLAVSVGASGLTVSVAAGDAFLVGSQPADQGAFAVYNDAAKVVTLAAADPSLPRADLIVARVTDPDAGGAGAFTLESVTGTAAASPADPTPPPSSLLLARVVVAAGAVAPAGLTVTDLRRREVALGAPQPCTSTTRPAAPYAWQVIVETDTGRRYEWTGTAWRWLVGNGPSPYLIEAMANATQAVASGGSVDVTFATELTDRASTWATNTFTAPVTGRYKLGGSIRAIIGTTGTWDMVMTLKVGGATRKRLWEFFGAVTAGWVYNHPFFVEVDLAAGQTVTIGYSSFGVGCTIQGPTAGDSHLSVDLTGY